MRSNVDSDGPLWFFVLIDNDAGFVTTQSHHVVHFSPCLLLYNSLTNNAHHAESCLLPFPFPSPLPFLPPLPPPSTRPFFPPLPSSSLPSLPFPPPPVPSIPFPSLFVEVGLLIAAKGSGSALAPSGSGRSPAAKRYLVNFKLKISPLVAANETSNWGGGSVNGLNGGF